MELGLLQRQSQALSAHMIQSMSVLEMGNQELLEYIKNMAEENPVLEIEENDEKIDRYIDLKQQIDWLIASDTQNRCYVQQDYEECLSYDAPMPEEQTLYEVIQDQMQERALSPQMYHVVDFLAASLDHAGWLDEPLSVLAQALGESDTVLMEALEILQSFEPVGIGARDLSECLQLQLKYIEHPLQPLALTIVKDHLEALAKFQYNAIFRANHASMEQIYEACELIRTLDPRPGARFGLAQRAPDIIPEFIIAEGENGLELLSNDAYLPSLKISSYYTQLMQEEPAVQAYLIQQIQRAKGLIRCIEQRSTTLERCMQCIMEFQKDFFTKGISYVAPLTLHDVAQKLGIHESTVSRVLKNKYIQCTCGVYPISYFFSRNAGNLASDGNRRSIAGAKALLKMLIQEEDKRKPLSDQKLCDLMEAQGYQLSRRTIAQYRTECRIPNASGRKKIG